jgi:hypothetical protein
MTKAKITILTGVIALCAAFYLLSSFNKEQENKNNEKNYAIIEAKSDAQGQYHFLLKENKIIDAAFTNRQEKVTIQLSGLRPKEPLSVISEHEAITPKTPTDWAGRITFDISKSKSESTFCILFNERNKKLCHSFENKEDA